MESNPAFPFAMNIAKTAPAQMYVQDSATGDWRPLRAADMSAQLNLTGDLTVNSQPSVAVTGDVTIAGATFISHISGLTSGILTIPVGAKAWSVAVESGSCYVNQTVLNEGTSLNGGGFDGRCTLSQAIIIGCTGGRTLISWDV